MFEDLSTKDEDNLAGTNEAKSQVDDVEKRTALLKFIRNEIE